VQHIDRAVLDAERDGRHLLLEHHPQWHVPERLVRVLPGHEPAGVHERQQLHVLGVRVGDDRRVGRGFIGRRRSHEHHRELIASPHGNPLARGDVQHRLVLDEPIAGITIAAPLCSGNGTINLAGYQLSIWAYFTVSAGSIPQNAANCCRDS
jgi:hypothetical protein